MKTKIFILLLMNSILAFADYSQSPQQQADKYMNEIREREERTMQTYSKEQGAINA